MASFEERLQQVERQVERFTPSLNERIERIEQVVEAANSEPPASPETRGLFLNASRRFLGWMGAELPKFLAAAVLLVFGWYIKDSVDLAIKQRQLDLSYAKEMQGLLQRMGDQNADMVQLESTAVVLASFGEPALPVLMSDLRYSGLRGDSAFVGIATLALTHPRAVCSALPRVLSNHTQQYDWQTHMKVVRLLGGNGCTEATKALQKYREIVAAAGKGKDEEFIEMVREAPAAPAEDYPRLLKVVDWSLGMLKQ